jgi:hypothetical protein
MAQWTMTDNAAGSPIWAVQQLNKTPNTANRNALYINTTASAYHTGRTDGTFGVSPTEMAVSVAEAVGELLAVPVTNAGTGIIDLDPWPSITIEDGEGAETLLYLAVTDAEITNVGTGFVPGETLTYDINSSTTDVVLTTIAVQAVSAAIDDPGSGYSNDDVIRVVGGTGETLATFDVTTGASDTEIASLAVNTAGSYTVIPADNAATTNVTGSGTGARITVAWGLEEIEITTPGNNSTWTANSEAMTANATSGDGTGDRITLKFGIAHVAVTNSGSGYSASSAVNASPAQLTGETFGFLSVSDGISPGNPVAHAGWQLRTVGSGGRAGRVFYETLFAASSMTNGTDDDAIFLNS